MADFSYLFISDVEPWRGGNTQRPPSMRHIATSRHAVAFAFKLLLSGDPKAITAPQRGPRKCFHVMGDRQAGVSRLLAFLRRIELPHAQPLIDDTIAFLNRPQHDARFFLLDPLDVFNSDEPYKTQINKLMNEIMDLDSAIEGQLAWLHEPLGRMTVGEPTQPGFIARLFGAKPKPALLLPAPDPLYRLERIGLQSWHEENGQPLAAT
jgi:hypothetical protein